MKRTHVTTWYVFCYIIYFKVFTIIKKLKCEKKHKTWRDTLSMIYNVF